MQKNLFVQHHLSRARSVLPMGEPEEDMDWPAGWASPSHAWPTGAMTSSPSAPPSRGVKKDVTAPQGDPQALA